MPRIGDVVILRTPGRPIAGEIEHAAIVTMVHSPSVVNVTAFMGNGQVLPVSKVTVESNINRAERPADNGWRERTFEE